MKVTPSLISLILTVSTAVAIHLDTPDNWTTTGPNTLTFEYVSTDPLTYAAVLVNQDGDLVPTSITLNKQGKTHRGQFTFTPATKGANQLKVGSGYQVNEASSKTSITSTRLYVATTFSGTSNQADMIMFQLAQTNVFDISGCQQKRNLQEGCQQR
ncbi:hypothetical protein P7C70_g1059, partial [Phenoliferia sp. Uapishka_3]